MMADQVMSPASPPANVPVVPLVPAKPPKAIIHLLVPHPAGKIQSVSLGGEFHGAERTFDLACLPGSTLPRHATGETGAVTCPLCKASAAFTERKKIEEGPGPGSFGQEGGTGNTGKHPADVAAEAELTRLSCC